MSLYLGSSYAIIVSSPELAKEIQKHDLAFSGRAIPAAAEAHDHDKMSVAFLPVGSQWRQIRKISKEHMFTTSGIAATNGLRYEKLQQLCDYIESCCVGGRETVVNLRDAAFITTLNLMSSTLFSIQVSGFDSNASQEFKQIFEGLTNVMGVPNLADFFPILKPFDPQGIRREAEFYLGNCFAFIENIINKRLQARSMSDWKKKSDFLEKLIDLSQGSEYDIGMDVIKNLLLDLFLAGADTTASAVEWVMVDLLFHPEKLSKVKHELRAVIGDKNTQIEESDISRLPYLQAVVKETFRLHPPAPLLIPHKAEYDVEVAGYTIPRGTQILVNIWLMGRDPSIWSNPDAFEPERYLGQKIDFKGQYFELIPFGSGRRMCPGLLLANTMLHIMVATLIHKFDWKLEAGDAYEHHKGQLLGVSLRSPDPLKAIPIKP